MIRRLAAGSLALAALTACAHANRPGTWAVDPNEAAEPGAGGQPPKVSAAAYQHYLDALLARNAEDYTTAATELREALLYDPGSPHLHAVLADVLLKQGRVADAETELKTALSLDPQHGPSHLLTGRIDIARGLPMQARDHFQAALEAEPDDPDAYRELARLLLTAGDVEGAEALAKRLGVRLQAAQKLSASDSDEALVTADRLRDQAAALWVEVGRYQAQHGNDAAAQRAFAEARAASPADPDALIAEATYLESKRKYPEARERYLRLLAQRPEAPEVLAALARVAISEGDVDAVTAHSRKLRGMAANLQSEAGAEREDDRRDLSGALLRVAVALLGAHRGAEAQEALEAALRLHPHHPELSFYRALALAQRGKVREGALAFESVERRLRAAGGDPVSPAFLGIDPEALGLDARVQAALARARAGETQEAMRRLRAEFAERPAEEGVALALLEAFDRAGKAAEAGDLLAAAVRSHPGADGLLYALGNAQDRAGARQKALSTMRKALAVQPQHAGALNYIGYTLTEQGKPADLREAEGLLARAVELRPEDGAIADSYGYCLLKLGRAAEALAELQRADRLSPADPVILSHLGDALLVTGRKQEALSAFHRALSVLRSGKSRAARARATQARVDPPDRPDREDRKVRAEIEQKLKALSP